MMPTEAKDFPESQERGIIMKYMVIISNGANAESDEWTAYRASFESRAKTNRGILAAAAKALHEKGVVDFDIELGDIYRVGRDVATGKRTLKPLDTINWR